MTDIFPQHASKLAGVWEMRSYDLYDSFGPDKKYLSSRHGDKPFGRVVIASSGYISAHLTPPDHAIPLSGETPQSAWHQASNDEVAGIARPYSAYAGTLKLFERDEESRKDGEGLWEWECVTEIALNPNLIGTKQYRRVRLEEADKEGRVFMMLSPRNFVVREDGRKAVGVLRWEKVRGS